MHVAPTIVDAPDLGPPTAVDAAATPVVQVSPAVVIAVVGALSGFVVGCLAVGLLWLLL